MVRENEYSWVLLSLHLPSSLLVIDSSTCNSVASHALPCMNSAFQVHALVQDVVREDRLASQRTHLNQLQARRTLYEERLTSVRLRQEQAQENRALEVKVGHPASPSDQQVCATGEAVALHQDCVRRKLVSHGRMCVSAVGC